jgi:hypothetical protein
VLCESPLVDALGNALIDNDGDPELCGKVYGVSQEPGRNRLGFRLRCLGNHIIIGSNVIDRNRRHGAVRLNPFIGSIFDRPHIKFRTFLKILLSVFMKRGFHEILEQVGGSAETISNYVSVIKEAVAVCGWHDQGKVLYCLILTIFNNLTVF